MLIFNKNRGDASTDLRGTPAIQGNNLVAISKRKIAIQCQWIIPRQVVFPRDIRATLYGPLDLSVINDINMLEILHEMDGSSFFQDFPDDRYQSYWSIILLKSFFHQNLIKI